MKARWIPILFGLAFLVVIVICVSNTSFVAQDGKRYFTIEDDALISLRYAWNLAHGHGLVWNTGERVEGFTNPLWTLYAASWALFTSRRLLPLVIQLSGAACLLAQAVVFMRIVRVMMKERGRASPWREAVAFVLPFVYGPLVYWSLEGLEVCLVGFLISWAVLFYLKRGWRAMAVVLGLAFWTRPDTAIPAAMMMGLAGLDALSNRGLRRPWLKSCGWLAGMVAAVFLAREIYYGHTWPNTYVLKMRGFPFMQRITLNGIGYITPFLWENALPLSLALLTLVWGWTRRRALFAAMILPMSAYAVYVGGDALPHWRFIAPYVPFLGLILLDDDCDVMQPSKYSCVPNMIMVTVSLSAWMATAVQPIYKQLHSPQPFERANIETALELNRLLKPGATIGVLHAGSIPYYTDFHAYDFLGKCDWTIARLPPDLVDSPKWGGMRSVPGHNKHDLYASITRHKPTYIQSYWWGHDNVVDYVRENYEFVPTAIRSPFTETWLLLRKNSPDVRWELIHTGTTKPSIASPAAPS